MNAITHTESNALALSGASSTGLVLSNDTMDKAFRMAERITLEAPEMRTCNQVAAVRTSTNILIGCNYRRPMPQPSADAERIQAALLAKPARRASDGWAFWLTLLACVLVFVLMSGCGPTETEAMQDVAADLADAQATALLTAQGRAK